MNAKTFELREWQLSDTTSLAENANNIRIWNNVRDYFPHPYSEEDGKQFIQMVSDKPKPAVDMAIVIDGKAVGDIGIVLQSDVERISAELGYWLGENYWNKGIMTNAVKQMVSYAFLHFPELRKIYATLFDFNIASQKVLQKAGFEREAVLKQAAIKNGKVIDLHYYSIMKVMKSELEQIPGIGKNMARHLINVGYPSIESLKGQDPEEIYFKDCMFQGVEVDRCVLYVYRLAVAYANGTITDPEKLKWWNWKD